MTLWLFLLLILMAAVATVLVIIAGSEGRIGSITIDRRTGIVVSAFVFILWGIVAVNSFEVTTHSGGQGTQEEYVEIAFLAVAGAAVALVSMIKATVEEIDSTGGI